MKYGKQRKYNYMQYYISFLWQKSKKSSSFASVIFEDNEREDIKTLLDLQEAIKKEYKYDFVTILNFVPNNFK